MNTQLADGNEGTLAEGRRNAGLTCSQRDIVERQEGGVGGADAGAIGKADQYSVVSGKLIGVKLRFPQLDQYDRKIHGHITLCVASVYQPVDKVEHADLMDTLCSIMTSVPKSVEFIGGNDANANLGIRTKMYQKTLVHGASTTVTLRGEDFLDFQLTQTESDQ